MLCYEDIQDGRIDLVKQVINKDNVNEPCKDSYVKNTPLHYACRYGHIDIVKYLISKGTDVNIKDDDDQTPLHYACRYGHIDIVKYLVSKGADINIKNKFGYSPLDYAIANNRTEIKDFLRLVQRFKK